MELDIKSRSWLLHSAIEYRKKTNLKVKDPKFIDYMFEKQREKGITLSRLQLLSFVNDPMGKKGAKNSNLPTSSESSVDTPARTKQPPQQPRLNTNDQDAEATSTGKHTHVEQKDFVKTKGAVKMESRMKNDSISYKNDTKNIAKIINPEIVEVAKTLKSEEDLSGNEKIREKVQGKAASVRASKTENVPAVEKTKKSDIINMPLKQMCFNVGDKKQLVATTDLSENHVHPTKEVLTIKTKKTKSKTITPEKVLLTPVNADVDKPESDNKQIQIKVTPGKNLDESRKTPAVEKSTTNSKTVTPSKPVVKRAIAKGLQDVPLQFEIKKESEIEVEITNIPSSEENKISEKMDGASQVAIGEKISKGTRAQKRKKGLLPGVKPDDETEETSKTEMKSNNISPNNKIQVSENHDSAIESTVRGKRSSRSHSSSSSSSIAELKPTEESQSTSASPSATTTAEISSQDFEPNALEDGESQEYKFKVGQNSPSEEVNSVNPVNGRQATVGGKRNTRSRSACSALKVEPDTQPPSKKPRTSNTTGNNSEVADQNTGNRNDTDIKRELIKQEFIKKERRKPKKVGPVRKAYLKSRKIKYNEKKRMEREMQLGIIPVPSLSSTPQSPYIPMVRPHVYSAHCWQRPPGIIPLRPRYFPRGNKPRFPPWPHNALNQHHRMQPRMNWHLPVNVTSPRQNMGYPRQCGRLRAEPVEHTGSASTRCNDNFDPMRSYPSTARFSNSTIEPQKEPRQEEVMAAIGLGPSNFERTILQEPTGMDTTDDSTNKSEEDTLPNFDPILFPFKKIKLPAPQTLTPPLCSVEDVVPILGDAVGSHQSTDSSAEATAQDMESSDTATGVFSLSQSDLSANLGTEGLSSLNSRVGQSPPLSPSMLFPETPRSSRQSPSEESSGQNIIVEANNNTVDSLQEDGAKKLLKANGAFEKLLKAFEKKLLRLEARDRYRGKQLTRMERANQKRFLKTQYVCKDIAKTQRKMLLQFSKFLDEKNKK